MERGNLPISLEALEHWQGEAPDPVAHPEYYEGVVARRVLAYLVDLVLIALVFAVLWLLVGALTVMSFGLLGPLLWPALAVVPLAYHTLLIGGEGSATLGMRLFRIEVRTWDGRRPGYLQAALVTVVFYVSVVLTSWLVLVVALFNRQRRTLHDYLCGTIVINALNWSALPVPRA
jgi:uncharacterized RDD family membrane protein YckC